MSDSTPVTIDTSAPGDTTPVSFPDDTPRMPPPSAVVEPFVSGGGPPPSLTPPPKRSGRGLLIFLLIILLIVSGVFVYIKYGSQLSLPKVGYSKPTPIPTTALKSS